MAKRKQPTKEIKSEEDCVTETLNYIEPELEEDGDMIMDNGIPKIKTSELFDVKSCYLQGMDLNDINQTKSIPIIQFLSEKLINLPVYIINGHGSIDPRIKIEMGNEDSGRVTRAAKRTKSERAEKINYNR